MFSSHSLEESKQNYQNTSEELLAEIYDFAKQMQSLKGQPGNEDGKMEKQIVFKTSSTDLHVAKN